MNDLKKVVAITSLPTVGNAGLKNMMSILGTRLLPVPTLLISGLGNMEGHRRFDVPFEELLHETFAMAERQGYQLIVYVGYLHQASQVDAILRTIEKFSERITSIIIDPVCGDNGQAYINQDIIDRLPKLLKKADWAFPNETEVRILSGFDYASDLGLLQKSLLKAHPAMRLITTGVKDKEKIYNEFRFGPTEYRTEHRLIYQPVSGTGDAFVALFILMHFFQHEDIEEALLQAGDAVSLLVQKSQQVGRSEMNLDAFTLSDLSFIQNDLTP
ncbi:MAG: PfkB family carbohydrate kinase [Bacteroidota bacterium]